MASRKIKPTFSGSPIEMGGFVRVEFVPNRLTWMVVNRFMPHSVKATIVGGGQKPYLQGRTIGHLFEACP
jgi:hypothetical protein